MNHRQAFVAVATILLLLVAFEPNCVHAGSVTYEISVDTSAVSGQGGYLDFQFNPGDSTAEAATASVTGFQTTGGILATSATLTGDATGLLPGALTLDSGTTFNDVFQGFTYGNGFSLDLTLSGQALDSPGGTAGSSFALSLYAADGMTPLLTTDPNGSVVTVNLNPDGTTSAETFPQSPTNNTPVAFATTAAVPEPSSIVLLAVGLLAGLVVVRHLRR